LFDIFTKTNFPEIEDIEDKATHMQLLLTDDCCDIVHAEGVHYCEKNPFDAVEPEDQIKKGEVGPGPNNEYAGETVVGTKVYQYMFGGEIWSNSAPSLRGSLSTVGEIE